MIIGVSAINKTDIWVNQNIHLIQNSSLTPVMTFITNLASPIAISVFTIILIAWFFRKKLWWNIFLTTTALGGGFLIESVLKIIIARPRPLPTILTESTYSFPSGHATMGSIFFLLLIYFFKDQIKNNLTRQVFILSNIFIFILIGFSRIYLGVHWLSDVVAGFIFGISWLTFVLWLSKTVAPKTQSPTPTPKY